MRRCALASIHSLWNAVCYWDEVEKGRQSMIEVHTLAPTQLLATRTWGKGRREKIKF